MLLPLHVRQYAGMCTDGMGWDGMGWDGMGWDGMLASFSHLARKLIEVLACPGGKVSRDAGPVKGGDSIIAFVDDPTGYKWEIIGSKGKPIPEPIAQVRCSGTHTMAS